MVTLHWQSPKSPAKYYDGVLYLGIIGGRRTATVPSIANTEESTYLLYQTLLSYKVL